MEIELEPKFLFKPYPYQAPVFDAVNDGIRRLILVWPRRSGKDLTLLNLMVIQSQIRVGSYFYFFPTHKQAKRVLWDGMDDEGNKFLSYIPSELVAEDGFNESELQITLANGSIIQLLGADTVDTSALGTNCVGVVLSEYPVQQAAGWNYVRPILAKNGGWAAFGYTPRGHNHGYDLYETNKDNPDWYVSKLEAYDILGHDNERLLTDEMIDFERRSGMLEEMIQQEFFTSFSGIQAGAFFGDQLVKIETDEPPRIGMYPYTPDELVHTVSDLGVGLRFFTWFFQVQRGMVRWIDCNQLDSGAIPEFVKMVNAKPYVYGDHFAPFDINTVDQSTGFKRIDAAAKLNLHFRALPKLLVSDRVDIARRVLPISIFNEVTTRKGWKALLGYRRKYNEELREFSNDEIHDENSHGGASFTYGCVAIRRFLGVTSMGRQAFTEFNEFENEKPRQSYETEFDEFVSPNEQAADEAEESLFN